ncbi:nucleoside deaminase [Lignipirellula cremea]|uniref:Guanine deaminase n=1 Tax=Lignipirellula cremea TaxID=2528010 RepID=A0A518DU16_9BACT|nr:nucleoside deaminase [Lignipirellula cremea]QDU95326.1 Guanine deaminase [Lignipirellula cremea]
MQPHDYYMQKAIQAARNNKVHPFGAVIVDRRDGQIVADGFNRSSLNPTWHGEIDAINRCATEHRPGDWSPLSLYTTAEPCPMCQSAILWSGIGEVYFGVDIARLQELGWRQIEIPAAEVVARFPQGACLVEGGILREECDALFRDAAFP